MFVAGVSDFGSGFYGFGNNGLVFGMMECSFGYAGV